MNKEDFKNVEDMIKDIEDVSYEKIGYLKELISQSILLIKILTNLIKLYLSI